MANLYIFKNYGADCKIAAAIIIEMYKELVNLGKHTGFDNIELYGASGYIEPVEDPDDEYVFIDIDILDTIEDCTSIIDILSNGNKVIALYNRHDYSSIYDIIKKNMNNEKPENYEFEAGLTERITTVAYRFANRKTYESSIDREIPMFYLDREDADTYMLALDNYDMSVQEIFKKIIRRNNYNIFLPDEYTTKKLDGFYNARVKDGKLLAEYAYNILDDENITTGFVGTLIDSGKNTCSVKFINTHRELTEDEILDYYKNYPVVISYYFNGSDYVYRLYNSSYSDGLSQGLCSTRKYECRRKVDRVIINSSVYDTLYMKENPFRKSCSIYLNKKQFKHRYTYTVKIV